jgi:hypothetical protein
MQHCSSTGKAGTMREQEEKIFEWELGRVDDVASTLLTIFDMSTVKE